MTDKLTEDEWADLQTLTAYDREGCVSVRLSVFDKLIAEVRETRAAAEEKRRLARSCVAFVDGGNDDR